MAQFQADLRALGVEVEPLDLHRGVASLDAGLPHGALDLDALLAGPALAPGRILVTSTTRDFPQGLRKTTPGALRRRSTV